MITKQRSEYLKKYRQENDQYLRDLLHINYIRRKNTPKIYKKMQKVSRDKYKKNKKHYTNYYKSYYIKNKKYLQIYDYYKKQLGTYIPLEIIRNNYQELENWRKENEKRRPNKSIRNKI